MGGLMYSAVFEEVAVTAAQDLFTITAPSDAVVVLHGLWLGQSSDAGDSESEMLPLLFHLPAAAGSGGGSATPRPLQLGNPAAGSTVDINDTTQATEGNQLFADTFNVLAGYQWIPTPEMRIYISPSDILTIELQSAPADSITLSGTIIFEEIGG